MTFKYLKVKIRMFSKYTLLEATKTLATFSVVITRTYESYFSGNFAQGPYKKPDSTSNFYSQLPYVILTHWEARDDL